MTTDTLPDLPTPKYTETIRGVPCITVTEHEHLMRTYALQAIAHATQPAEVTRDEVMQAAKEATAPEWQDVVDGWHMGLDLMAFARAILALRPVQVPMNSKQREEVFRAAEARIACGINLSWRNAIVEEVEAYYGITAQAKKETP